ncbi:acyltransferase 3 [Novosphingobium sp. PY1]|nr:acyltransferase 3 [Novosphingobium sp. PY1]GFM31403.1 acyltransferase 3 [Novosphingobium sp. PY1]
MQYRKDIDGLRAIAVGGVVLYHAFPGFLPGGYVGVDVFFVISGFLITSIIASEAQAGTFSIGGFYERRFRRILPALAFMLALTTLASTLILPPGELEQYGQSLVAVALFGSNVLFWHEGGYFDGPAGDKPLLHTWSLAVEEQFYIAWPLIAAGLIMLGHRRLLRHFIWFAILVSLGAAEFVVRHWPSQAFYLIPYRAWELGFGALLAVGAVPALRRRWQREMAGWTGLALISLPMLFYNEETRFPGLSAVLPCLGTLLLIHAGQGTETTAGRALSRPAAVYIGLISYSFYLWHWPVLVLSHIALNRPLQVPEAGFAVMAAFALAAISLHFVERPFRGRGTLLPGRRLALAASAIILSLFAAAGLGAWRTNGLAAFASPAVTAAMEATASINPYRSRCHSDGHNAVLSAANDCTAGRGPEASGYQVLLWGDSHSDHLMPGLARLAEQKGFRVRQSTVSGCSPLVMLSNEVDPLLPTCAELHRETLREAARQPDLRAVILSARWSTTVQSLARTTLPDGSMVRSDRVASDALRTELTALVAQIRKTLGDGPEIILIGSTPEFGFWPANCFARAAKFGSDASRCRKASAEDAHWGPLADSILARIKAQRLTVVLPRATLCARHQQCLTAIGDSILFRDDDHLSNEGSQFIAAQIDPQLTQALQ